MGNIIIYKWLVKKYKLTLFFILIFATLLRFIGLEEKKFWIDEKWSVMESTSYYIRENNKTLPVEEIKDHNTVINVIKSNVQLDSGNGIIYFLSLHFWLKLFGTTVLSLRMLSLITGILVIVALGLLTNQLFNNKFITLISLFYCSIHPDLIHFSQEGRPYNFAILFTLISSLFFFKIYHEKTKLFNFIVYGVFASLSLLSHYSTVYILSSHFIISMLNFNFFKKNWKKILFSFSLIFSILSIWMLNFGFAGLEIMSHKSESYIQKSLLDPTNSTYKATNLLSLSQGWAQNIISLFGVSLVSIGVKIRYNIILLFPFLFLFTKSIIANYNKSIYILIVLIFSSLFYATTLSLISGNILPFQTLYGVFSTPYTIIFLSFLIHKDFLQKYFGWTSFIIFFMVITSSSFLFFLNFK